MDERIFRLLNRPVSKWTKGDSLYAARLLSTEFLSTTLTGLIHRHWLSVIALKLSSPTGASTSVKHGPRKRGRPEKLTKECAAENLRILEIRRHDLAKERGVQLSKVTDKDVAFRIAEHTLRTKGDALYLKDALGKDMQNWIKYLKRKVKSG